MSENANVCDLDEICNFIDKGTIPQKPTVAITFDDGFYDAYAFIEPILAKYRVKGTVFVVTSRVEDKAPRPTLRDYWNGKCSLQDFERPSPLSLRYRDCTFLAKNAFMRVEELIRCDRGSLKVESHGHLHLKYFSHPLKFIEFYKPPKNVSPQKKWWLKHVYPKIKSGFPIFKMESSLAVRKVEVPYHLAKMLRFRNPEEIDLSTITKTETEKEQTKRILDELQTSKTLLENWLGREIIHICWPWGEYKDLSIQLALKAGYKACYTTLHRNIDKSCSITEIPRHRASNGWPKFVRKFYKYSFGRDR